MRTPALAACSCLLVSALGTRAPAVSGSAAAGALDEKRAAQSLP